MNRGTRLVAFLLVFVGGFAWSLPGRVCLCSLAEAVFGAEVPAGASGQDAPRACCPKACCSPVPDPRPGPAVQGNSSSGDCCLEFDGPPDRPEVKTVPSTIPMVDLAMASAVFVPTVSVRATIRTAHLSPPSQAPPEFHLPLRI